MTDRSFEITAETVFTALRRRWRCILAVFAAFALLGSLAAYLLAPSLAAEGSGEADPIFTLSPDLLILDEAEHFTDYRIQLLARGNVIVRYLAALAQDGSLSDTQRQKSEALLSRAQTLQEELRSLSAPEQIPAAIRQQNDIAAAANEFAARTARENHLIVQLETLTASDFSVPDDVASFTPSTEYGYALSVQDRGLLFPSDFDLRGDELLFRVLIAHTNDALPVSDVVASLALFSALSGLCIGLFAALCLEVRARRGK